MIYSSLNIVVNDTIVGHLRSMSPVGPGHTDTEYKHALEGILYDLKGFEVVEFDYLEIFLSEDEEQKRITFQDFCYHLISTTELDLSSMYGDLLKHSCYILHKIYEDVELAKAKYYLIIR